MAGSQVPECNRCHRKVPSGRLVAGYGMGCAWRYYGLRPERKPRVRSPVRTGGWVEAPVLDGLNELENEVKDESERRSE